MHSTVIPNLFAFASGARTQKDGLWNVPHHEPLKTDSFRPVLPLLTR